MWQEQLDRAVARRIEELQLEEAKRRSLETSSPSPWPAREWRWGRGAELWWNGEDWQNWTWDPTDGWMRSDSGSSGSGSWSERWCSLSQRRRAPAG